MKCAVSLLAAAASLLAFTACSTIDGPAAAATSSAPSTSQPNSTATVATTTTTSTTSPSTTSTSTTSTSTTTTTLPTFTLRGSVRTPDGTPLPGVVVDVGGAQVTSDATGSFWMAQVPAGTISLTRFAWLPQQVEWDGAEVLDVTLQPHVVRALRAIPAAAGDKEEFRALLDLADSTAVNAIVFDTKDETGRVRYATSVPEAHELDAINPTYNPVQAISEARDRGLYTITRIVTFEDEVWTARDPAAKLAGYWIDPTIEANWEYPLALAEEACGLGFDEIQFDYVRFPAGRTAEIARPLAPATADGRVAAIEAFLTAAKERLHPLGCALSADIFAIVVSSETDEGIGQRPEDLSRAVDAISPMVYPSHYSPGWLGFADPNDHPGPVTADAIDDALPRLAPGTLLRPWLQAFYYTPAQIRQGIDEAEERSVGWMLWHAGGEYDPRALPAP